jgi:pyruvate dehydrogenase E1 component beta subunit
MEAISKSVRKTRKVIIVEECMKTGGIGASLSAVINESLFNDLDHEVVRLSSQVIRIHGAVLQLFKEQLDH